VTTDLGPREPLALREELALEAQHYHVPEQAKRFGRIFLYTLAAQLISSGGHLTGWTGLCSLLAGSAEMAFRQWRKTMAVRSAQQVADEHEQVTPWPPAAAG
jgi:hypothetical protein